MSASDSSVVLATLLRARLFDIKVGRFTFKFERPTPMEIRRMKWANGQIVQIDLEVLESKCRGWEGVLESDILGANGASDPCPFSQPLWRAFIADRSDLWDPIGDEVAKKIEEHDKNLEALKGN